MSRYIDIKPIIEWCNVPEVCEPYGVNSVELEQKLLNAPTIKTKRVKYYDDDENVWKIGEVIVNSSEKPNNCEHITEDGVTCAKYPACDDCLDNPLNKVKGSERLVKGSEQTDCQTCKWWSSYGYCVHRECKGYEPQTERSSE